MGQICETCRKRSESCYCAPNSTCTDYVPDEKNEIISELFGSIRVNNNSVTHEYRRCKYYEKHLETIREYIGCLYNLEGCCCGGELHILLDDDNYDDDSILYCLKECLSNHEREESVIGRIICEEYLKLTMPQRRLLTQPYINDFQCWTRDCEKCFVETGDEQS